MNDDPIVGLRLFTQNVRLAHARQAKGYNQTALGHLMGRSAGWISHVENLWFIPSEEWMLQFAIKLEQPVNYLFPEELLNAIRNQVFGDRYKEIGAPELVSLTNAEALRLSYDDEYLIEEAERQELSEKIHQVLTTLSPREQRVLELRFGLSGQRSAMSLSEVGKEFSVTRVRIMQIEAKALRKLRRPARARRLIDYLD